MDVYNVSNGIPYSYNISYIILKGDKEQNFWLANFLECSFEHSKKYSIYASVSL